MTIDFTEDHPEGYTEYSARLDQHRVWCGTFCRWVYEGIEPLHGELAFDQIAQVGPIHIIDDGEPVYIDPTPLDDFDF